MIQTIVAPATALVEQPIGIIRLSGDRGISDSMSIDA